MRIIFLLIVVCLTAKTAFAQDNFSKQLQAIIRDSANNFRQISGKFKDIVLDSVYHSNISIEGTKKNSITFIRRKGFYEAIIADSLNLETAQAIFDEWKKKIEKALGPSFKGEEHYSDWPYDVKNWGFDHGRLTVLLGLSQMVLSQMFKVTLNFIL